MRPFRSVVLAALVVLAGTIAAFSHAKMTMCVPEDGSTVAAGLSEIELKFSHPMRLTLVRVHRGGDEGDVPLQGALPQAFADAAKVAVTALAAGAYEVSWTAVSQDGHVVKGQFAFKVTAPAAAAQ